jgi:hypothetical protein
VVAGQPALHANEIKRTVTNVLFVAQAVQLQQQLSGASGQIAALNLQLAANRALIKKLRPQISSTVLAQEQDAAALHQVCHTFSFSVCVQQCATHDGCHLVATRRALPMVDVRSADNAPAQDSNLREQLLLELAGSEAAAAESREQLRRLRDANRADLQRVATHLQDAERNLPAGLDHGAIHDLVNHRGPPPGASTPPRLGRCLGCSRAECRVVHRGSINQVGVCCTTTQQLGTICFGVFLSNVCASLQHTSQWGTIHIPWLLWANGLSRKHSACPTLLGHQAQRLARGRPVNGLRAHIHASLRVLVTFQMNKS